MYILSHVARYACLVCTELHVKKFLSAEQTLFSEIFAPESFLFGSGPAVGSLFIWYSFFSEKAKLAALRSFSFFYRNRGKEWEL